VREASLAEDLEHRVVVVGTLREFVRRKPLDGRQMTTPEKVRQVRRETQMPPPKTRMPLLLRQRLEDRLRWLAIELDAQLIEQLWRHAPDVCRVRRRDHHALGAGIHRDP
jgi:hypothetical protein